MLRRFAARQQEGKPPSRHLEQRRCGVAPVSGSAPVDWELLWLQTLVVTEVAWLVSGSPGQGEWGTEPSLSLPPAAASAFFGEPEVSLSPGRPKRLQTPGLIWDSASCQLVTVTGTVMANKEHPERTHSPRRVRPVQLPKPSRGGTARGGAPGPSEEPAVAWKHPQEMEPNGRCRSSQVSSSPASPWRGGRSSARHGGHCPSGLFSTPHPPEHPSSAHCVCGRRGGGGRGGSPASISHRGAQRPLPAPGPTSTRRLLGSRTCQRRFARVRFQSQP